MQNNSPLTSRTRWHFHWILPLVIQSRATLTSIAEVVDGVWQTPLLLLAISGLLRTMVAGSLQAAAASGEIALPLGFEYYTAEQQAQFMQAATATSSPFFVYVLPTLFSWLGLLFNWLVLSWLVHLVLTLMGGRNSHRQIMNLTAWAMLPLFLRDVVQVLAMLRGGQLLAGLGLSGLVVADSALSTAYLIALLSQVDLYLFWQIGLLLIGTKLASTLSWTKVWLAVGFSFLLLLMIRALPSIAATMVGDLSIVQPFF